MKVDYCDFDVENLELLPEIYNALMVCDVSFTYNNIDPIYGHSFIRAYCSRFDLLNVLRSELEFNDLAYITTLNHGKINVSL